MTVTLTRVTTLILGTPKFEVEKKYSHDEQIRLINEITPERFRHAFALKENQVVTVLQEVEGKRGLFFSFKNVTQDELRSINNLLKGKLATNLDLLDKNCIEVIYPVSGIPDAIKHLEGLHQERRDVLPMIFSDVKSGTVETQATTTASHTASHKLGGIRLRIKYETMYLDKI